MNRINWNAIRAEYIGGTSIRALARKYGVNKSTIGAKCSAERWTDSRTKAADKARAKAVQKTADAAADNATIAQEIKRALLLLLQRMVESYPEDATEIRQSTDDGVMVWRLRDLTAAYKDLFDGMNLSESPANELLLSLLQLEREK